MSCVESTDPLFFTCELIHVFLLRVEFPNGAQESISKGYNSGYQTVVLPAGFKVVSLHIVETDEYKRNISLTLLIVNASLLDGGEIICDDTTNNKVMAGCQVCGKF